MLSLLCNEQTLSRNFLSIFTKKVPFKPLRTFRRILTFYYTSIMIVNLSIRLGDCLMVNIKLRIYLRNNRLNNLTYKRKKITS